MWCLIFKSTIFYCPRRLYKTRIQKMFRQLPCNIQLVTAQEHKAIHQASNGTKGGMPTKAFMEAQIAHCFSQGCAKQSCKIGRNQPNEQPDPGGDDGG